MSSIIFSCHPEVLLTIEDQLGYSLEHLIFQTRCRLNEVGIFLWQCLEQPSNFENLCQKVLAEFEVEPTECEAAVRDFLEELHGLGFLEVVYQNLPSDPMREPYLKLLKNALTNLLYPEHELRIRHLLGHEKPSSQLELSRLLRDIRLLQPEKWSEAIASKQVGGVLYGEVTRYSHTAIGIRRLENLQACAEAVFADGIAGDFLEAGVCQGGASIFMRALQVAFGQTGRQMWLADSFEGLPVPSAKPDIDHKLDWSEPLQPWLAIDLETVQEHFKRYELLDNSVHFLKGWFADTLPNAGVKQLAILRLDGDLYSSTLEVLEALYERVSPGGFVIIDDYAALKPCREAVDYFRRKNQILEPLRRVDWSCVFWRKAS